MTPIDIGEYIHDRRLRTYQATFASFYGHGCDPAVYVQRTSDGAYRAYRSRIDEYSGRPVPSTESATAPTAVEALAQIIGPVQS